jgi:hypothetical protein
MPMSLDDLSASIDHLELICNKIERLQRVRYDTLRQLCYGIRREWHAGELTDEQILGLRRAFIDEWRLPNVKKAWDSSGLPSAVELARKVADARYEKERIRRHTSNDVDSGGWVGEWIDRKPSEPYPARGESVVYVLYGEDFDPVYCGSTESFRSRLKAHAYSGKEFVAWRAVPAPDREAAYQLEDRLLREHCPPLNKRAGR